MSETTKSNRSGLWVVVGIVAVVGVFAVTFLSAGTGDAGRFEIEAFGDPEVSGELLMLPPGSSGVVLDDPAAGSLVPEVFGQDFHGNEVSITNDGNAKIIVFLAHWCPHCQAEVPELVNRLAGGTDLGGVDLYAVATSSNSTRDNWTPAAWLEDAGFTAPVIMDDVNTSVLGAYGITSFPGWAIVASDGTLIARATGRLPAEAVDAVIQLAANS